MEILNLQTQLNGIYEEHQISNISEQFEERLGWKVYNFSEFHINCIRIGWVTISNHCQNSHVETVNERFVLTLVSKLNNHCSPVSLKYPDKFINTS